MRTLPSNTYVTYLSTSVQRRGERGFLAFLENARKLKTLRRGCLLLTDNEASFKTEWVRDFESDQGTRISCFAGIWLFFIILFLLYLFWLHCFPALVWSLGFHHQYFNPQLGHLEDPCDNLFHADVKRRYWKLVDNYADVSLYRQIHLIHEAYFGVKKSSVQRYFERCGIIGNEAPSTVLDRLFFENLYPQEAHLRTHKKQLKAYIQWKWCGKKTWRNIFRVHRFFELFNQK